MKLYTNIYWKNGPINRLIKKREKSGNLLKKGGTRRKPIGFVISHKELEGYVVKNLSYFINQISDLKVFIRNLRCLVFTKSGQKPLI